MGSHKMKVTDSGIYPVCWGCSRKYIGYSGCFGTHHARRVNPTTCRRSSLRIELIYMILTKPFILSLLQYQSSSGWVGKSHWQAFRRAKFISWLDLNIFCDPWRSQHLLIYNGDVKSVWFWLIVQWWSRKHSSHSDLTRTNFFQNYFVYHAVFWNVID